MAITIHQIANWNGQEKNALLSKADEIRIESAELWINRRMLGYESVGLDIEYRPTKVFSRQLLGIVARRKLLLWTHNQRRLVRAGEVCDLGTSEREAKTWKTKHVIQ